MKIFLSYSTKHKNIAREIKKSLEVYNFIVFLAHEDIKPSDEWIKVILKELNNCDIFLPIFTEDINKSCWVNQEIGIAIAKKKKIIPVKINIDPLGFINRIQALSLRFDATNKYNKIPFNNIFNILNVIARDKKLGKKFRAFIIDRFCNSPSYLDANRNTEELINLEKFTKEEIEIIIKESIKNNQIYEAHTARKLLIPFIKNQIKIQSINESLIAKFNEKF